MGVGSDRGPEVSGRLPENCVRSGCRRAGPLGGMLDGPPPLLPVTRPAILWLRARSWPSGGWTLPVRRRAMPKGMDAVHVEASQIPEPAREWTVRWGRWPVVRRWSKRGPDVYAHAHPASEAGSRWVRRHGPGMGGHRRAGPVWRLARRTSTARAPGNGTVVDGGAHGPCEPGTRVTFLTGLPGAWFARRCLNRVDDTAENGRRHAGDPGSAEYSEWTGTSGGTGVRPRQRGGC